MIYKLTRKNSGYIQSPEKTICIPETLDHTQNRSKSISEPTSSVHVPDMNDIKVVGRDIQN
jgi:hypothetical protein